MNDELTQRQADCLDAIRRSLATHGYPPTLREIGEAMGITSTNGVTDLLLRLERKGYIVREGLKSRAIVVVGDDAPPPSCAPPTPGRFIAPRRCLKCDSVTFADRCARCGSRLLAGTS